MKLSKVNGTYGAPMGRFTGPDYLYGKVRLEKVRLNQSGYDSGGAYWGSGMQLWHAEDSDGNEQFFRAPTREAAKKVLLAKFSDEISFYR